MGKRSDFKRRKNDEYDTPYKAVVPLIPYLVPGASFVEPCAGKGQLIDHLRENGLCCLEAFDIEPRAPYIIKMDAIELKRDIIHGADYIITNSPWTRQILHPLIEVFRKLTTTWLLLDADWAHTKQAVPYMPYCSMIVSVGRVSWMDNGVSSKDNCAWYRFGLDKSDTIFKGR